jgi:hypothetical protein
MAKKNMITNHSSQYPRAGDEPSITELSVAYHAGPPAIGFAGRQWQRGVPQTVSAAEWAAMHARRDFVEFDFKTHPHPNPLPSGGTEALEGEGKLSADPLRDGEGEIIDKE